MERIKTITFFFLALIGFLSTISCYGQKTLPIPHFLFEKKISREISSLRKNDVLLFQVPIYKMKEYANFKNVKDDSWLSCIISDLGENLNVMIFLDKKFIRTIKSIKPTFVFEDNLFLPAIKEEDQLNFVSPIVNSTTTEFFCFYLKKGHEFYFELGGSSTYAADEKRDVYREEYSKKLKAYLGAHIVDLQQ